MGLFQGRFCPICCTIWSLFGVLICGFLSIGANTSTVDYLLIGVTNVTLQQDAVGAFGGSAGIYAVFAIASGIWWIYHDYIKVKKNKKRYVRTSGTMEVELQAGLLHKTNPSNEPVEL
mmetsp:Transcript_11/g.47  ORF Transcript_11/g.47 Transcript_11/m.47 type:complete len:118 (-) Transcript_11:75-428(-)